jgi:hypothetical protein
MEKGERTKLHNAMRGAVASLASAANVGPRVEVSVGLAADTTNKRIDILFEGLRAATKTIVTDVTIVHALQEQFIKPGVECGLAGSAATTAGESIKHTKYQRECEARGYKLVPLAFDTYGALCAGGAALLKDLARRKCNRLGIGKFVGVPRELLLINVALMRGISRLLNMNIV